MRTVRQVRQALKEEDHRKALYATLVFTILLVLFFLLVSLEVPDSPDETVVKIAMEDVELDMGGPPKGGSRGSKKQVVPAPAAPQSDPSSAPETATQEDSPIAVPPPSEASEPAAEAPPSPPVDHTFAFGQKAGSGRSGEGQGSQFGSGTGVGGNGSGQQKGNGKTNARRKVIRPPSFKASAQEEGKIALDIYVNESGTVVRTVFKESKSTSGSDYLKKLAEKAARTMRYEARKGAETEYVGYQVFSFKKS